MDNFEIHKHNLSSIVYAIGFDTLIDQPFQNKVTVVSLAIMGNEGVPLKFVIKEAFTEFLNTVMYVFFSVEVLCD